MSLVWSGHRGHTGTHTVPRKTHQCPQTHPKHVSPAKEAALISRRGQIKPTSFYCNFYPSRISPSLQVQATETLIPIQMSLPGSSFIRKKKKKSLKTPQSEAPKSWQQAVCTVPGREGLTWPLLLEGRNATLPSLLRLLPPPCNSFHKQ